VGRFLDGATVAMTAGFLLFMSLASPAIAQDAGPPPGKDNGFDFFPGFPGGAAQVMFYVLVGIIIVFAGTLIGLIFYRGRADDDSGFTRSGS
jgi:hypothetical protein